MTRIRGLLAAAIAIGAATAVQALEIRSHTIDSGGGQSGGARFMINGSAGQPDANASVGPRFSLDGGFWPEPESGPSGDALFADSFE